MTGQGGGPPAAGGDPALASLTERLAVALRDAYPGWTGDLVPVGRGFEAAVFRTDLPPFGTVAIKAPWKRFPGGGYGADIDCRALLHQERALAAWAAENGLPAAPAFALHETEAQDFLVSPFVAADDRPPDPVELGRVLRALHAAPAPDLVPVVHGPTGDLRDAIAARVHHRLDRLAVLTGARLDEARGLPPADALRRMLPASRRHLLHMDFRPANLRCRDGRIVAVLDWSNAAVGDPAFELARMHEAGGLTDAVLDGYGDRDQAATPSARALYHLDAALMLAIVFRTGDPDPVRATRATERARALLGELHDL